MFGLSWVMFRKKSNFRFKLIWITLKQCKSYSRKSTSLYSVGPKDIKNQECHQESSGLSAVGLYLPAKKNGIRICGKPNCPEIQSPEHPLLNTENWERPFRHHGLNQPLFFFISADTDNSVPSLIYPIVPDHS